MKWLPRILLASALLAIVFALAAWFALPWYAQSLIDRSLEGKNISMRLNGPIVPNLHGLGFGRMLVSFSTPRDSCTGITSNYTVTLINGSISIHPVEGIDTGRPEKKKSGVLPGELDLDVALTADSIRVAQEPAHLLFADRDPTLLGRVHVSRKGGLALDVRPKYLDYRVENGTISTYQLRLEGISYRVRLAEADQWIQQPAPVKIASVLSGGEKTPISNVQATFGMQRDPQKPCTVTLTDCSVELFGWKAKSAVIDYSLRKKQTSFSLELQDVPLNELPGFSGGGKEKPYAMGTLSGMIPIEYRDSTITVRNAQVSATPATRLIYYDTDGKPWLSLEAGGTINRSDILSNLNATVILNSKNEKLSAITFSGFSSRFFGGSLTSSPLVFDARQKKSSFTIRMNDVPLLDRVRLQGDFSGSLKGNVSGILPVSIDNEKFSITNGHIFSKGGGSFQQSPPRRQESFSEALTGSGGSAETNYTFSEPDIIFNRAADGKASVRFSLKSLTRKSAGGEMELNALKGSLGLWQNAANPSLVSLRQFSATFFEGTVAIDQLDYDTRKKEASTILVLNNIPLQKLLDLQGVRKVSATGTVRGRIPLVMKNNVFEIPQGSLDAEHSGQIIYSTTPEEKAAANEGLKITYEALANFLYSEMISSITMQPDGKSVITLRLKGVNPTFQNGRIVQLNLTIEQNLLDLFRSLSLPSAVEEAISEKTRQRQK